MWGRGVSTHRSSGSGESYLPACRSTRRGRDALAVLADECGFILTLNNFDKAAHVEYPGAFHIGFMQDSRERVDEIDQRQKSDGFDVEPPKEFHGAWTFHFRAPGGFLVEVLHQHLRDEGL